MNLFNCKLLYCCTLIVNKCLCVENCHFKYVFLDVVLKDFSLFFMYLQKVSCDPEGCLFVFI